MEENDIIKKCGKGNPFTVPEGYFEHFTEELMQKLPEKEKPIAPELKITTWQRIKPLLYLAAMFVGMMLCIRYVVGDAQKDDNLLLSQLANNGQLTDQEIETIVDYSMMYDYTLYRYLTDAE